MHNLNALTITQALEGAQKKEFSSRELLSACRGEIEKKNGELNAFISLADREQAHLRSRDSRRQPSLYGIPVAVKDNILVKGMRATAGSKILENYEAAYDAAAVSRLKEAGAVALGKTNLDEFAMGSSTENSAFGPTKNPHDRTRVPGGSSGGSAAAVAADMCIAALGSDTGGSIRQPASFCGVVGLKPTYGAVSRHGLIALASSLDQIGPITKTVEDAEILFNIIRGQDPLDATTLLKNTARLAQKDIKKTVIGVPREYFEAEGLQKEVKEAVTGAIARFEEKGARTMEVSLPHTAASLATYYVLMPAEASSNLARYDGVRYGLRVEDPELWKQYKKTRGAGFGSEPTRRIMVGTYVLSAGYYDAYYKKAVAARSYIKADFTKAFEKVDVLMTPTAPTVAFKLGEKTADPLAMYASDVFTVPVNIAGLPALSIPCGQSHSAGSGQAQVLPIGLQIIAPWGREDVLFSLGSLYEKGIRDA